jgi:plastocyanin
MVAKPRPHGSVAERHVLVAVLAAGLFCTVEAGQSPATGTVSGQVQVVAKSSRRLVSAGAYPGRTVGLTPDHDPSELPNVVVFVKAKPTPSAPMRVVMRQSHEEFVPHLVAITTGSTVDFPNEDLIFHNVFSLSRTDIFDLGRYQRGRSRGRVFRKPGLVKVYCHLHSHMSALVRIFDHPFFVIPDAQGRFSIPRLPAGTYDVVAWHERAGEVTRSASVASGATAELSFSLPLTDDE